MRAAAPTPLTLTLSRLPTPLGVMLVALDGEGALRALDWESHTARMHRLLGRLYGPAGVTLVDGAAEGPVFDRLRAFFAGDVRAIDDIPVATGGTPFQKAVWAALREIPAGETWSYARLAKRIGRPSAVRAVGAANGANPVGVVVPCHRVIGAGGALTGYGGGMDRKAWLLRHEGAAFREAAA
jgi:methylated-DNA-[protein]-cysteine S-methyltransferase